jgi:DNA helicase-2/ATP-dependent DNA helicase PcrA
MMPRVLTADELLADLTDAQRAAVTTVDGPLLVIAAAGSGKTRVLTRRVAYLISQGIPPGAILAITFTNKAAGEMKERVGKVMGRPLRDWGRFEDRQPTICTFHSLCMRILRAYGERVGLKGLTIYDTSDQQKVVKEAIKLLEMSATNFAPSAVLSTISNAKNKLQTAETYASAAADFYTKQVARIYAKYQSLLEAQGAMDFDDLLLKTVRAFREHPDVLAELQDRFQYLMIDEYQDTNHAQYILAHVLAMRHHNICVVGDPDQSIYGWRGADIQNILDFKKDYPSAAEVKLEHNYRSTKTVLAVADALIKKNVHRVDKRLITDNPDGEKVDLYLCQDEHDEAHVVMQQLKKCHERGVKWDGMAIFYRTNSLSRVMEDALRRAGVPYVMARGTEFYGRKEIKDVISYLKTIANVLDEVSLERMVNTPPRGIGDTTIRAMQAYGISKGMGLYAAMCEVEQVPGLSSRARNAVSKLVAQVREWQRLANIHPEVTPGEMPPEAAAEPEPEPDLDDMFAAANIRPAHLRAAGLDAVPEVPMPAAVSDGKGTVTRLMETVIKQSGLEALYAKESKTGDDTGEGPLSNINELISAASEFDAENPEGTLTDYLTQVSLVADADHVKGGEGADSGGAVTMMTLHAAKGLEFPVVAMIGLEEGILPHSRTRGNPAELEEERRLCFVGITRAQDKLILTRAAYRTIRGLRERTVTSPFINELPPERVEVTDRAGPSGLAGLVASTSWAPDAKRVHGTTYKTGMLVRHSAFGVGRIVDLSGSGSQTRCVVEFQKVGRKTLFLEVAPMQPVEG